MENTKKFELNDEALDNIAGGAVTDADYKGCPFPNESTVRNKKGQYCKKCYGFAGAYSNPCYTARIRYSYATPPQVIITCKQCGSGFYPEDISNSILSPTDSKLNDWELA